MMDVGDIGLLGLHVEVIVRSQDIESVTILFLQMEDWIVKETIRVKKFAMEEDVKLMEGGDLGHLGQPVGVVVQCQDTEVVMNQFLQMEDEIVKVLIRRKNLVLEEDVKLMELGVTGHLGQVVKVIARCQDTETVTIQIQKMEDLTVRENIWRKKIVTEEDVKLMEVGDVGPFGQTVEVIVRNLDPEAAIVQGLQMEDLTVRETTWKTNPAMEEDVKLMGFGEVGLYGQVVEVIVQYQDPGNVTTQLQQMEDLIVRVKKLKTNLVLKKDVGKVMIFNICHNCLSLPIFQ